MFLKDIYGQSILKNKIRQISKTNIGHAYAFVGENGIGKKKLAKTFAALILCENHKDGEVCGNCKPCKLFGSNSQVDYYEVFSDKASISIEEIRNMQEKINIKPMYSSRKVYIIYDAHKMTVQAQNCLLKTLEEPPNYVTIILTTSNYDSLQDTIKSRIVKMELEKYQKETIEEFILNNYSCDTTKTELLIALSEGILGKVKEMIENKYYLEERNDIIDLLLKSDNIESVIDRIDFANDNKDRIDSVIKIFLSVFRDMLISKFETRGRLFINVDQEERLLNFAERYSIDGIIKKIELLENIYMDIDKNINYSIAVDNMFLKLREAN